MKISIENNIVKSVELEGSEKSVIIPDGVIGIAARALDCCYDRIDDLYIPTSVKKIEEQEIGSLKRIEVVAGNTSFYSEDNCLISYKQRKIIIGNKEGKIPKSAKIIGMNAYAYSEAEEIVIPDNIDLIEAYSFYYSKCRKVLMHEGVRVVKRLAFSRCSHLESVIIPSTAESIDVNAFEGVPALEAFVVDANNKRYKSVNGHLISGNKLICGCCNSIIPDCVKVIGDSSFATRSNIKSLSIPSSVSKIERCAFYRCSMLSDIFIPDSVKSIGDMAFFDCDSITVMPEINGVKVLENGVFGYCNNLRKIHIGKNIKEIIAGAFEKCPRIDEITVSDENSSYSAVENCLLTKDGKTLIFGCNSSIPEGVECIEKSAFAGSYVIGSKLEKVVMPSSLISICDFAFLNSKSLKQIILNEELRMIGNSAFSYSNLESITIPKGIKTISCCFCSCEKLKSITLPKGIKTIYDFAFAGCEKLESIKLLKGLKTIRKSVFADCKKLKSVEIQSTELKVISYSAFSGCSSLRSIVIPEGTETIRDCAFAGCGKLEEVVLPKSISYIGFHAFIGCTSLRQVDVPKNAQIDANAFDTNTLVALV